MFKGDHMKEEIQNLKVQTRRKEKINKKKTDWNWIIRITILACMISFIFSFVSEMTIPNVNVIIGILLVVVFILLGVLFDMIGVAVTAADEKTFHSMNARKVKGADLAVKFKKNADKVASFCNDVVGDICGIISGSAGAIIALSLSNVFHIDQFIITLVTTSIIAALTIGGKAIGKSYAINKSDIILYRFTKSISYFYQVKR